jgi:hypothetical protein
MSNRPALLIGRSNPDGTFTELSLPRIDVPAIHPRQSNDEVRATLIAVRDFWAGGDCPPDLWARIELALVQS